jgi:4-hydroxythreonine-4-phosphate dehydrogenase
MKIGITLGDPAGIGPEIVLKALSIITQRKNIAVFGSRDILRATARDLRLMTHYNNIKDNIIDCVGRTDFRYGRPTAKTGRAAMASIDAALQSGIDILITPPIVKEVIKLRYADFVGHTEYCAHFYGVKQVGMVGLWRDKRIMLLTTHMPLRHIFESITPQSILRAIIFFEHGLKKYFNITNPTIAVCALNPHAFEFSLGEDEKIEKGILRARKKGIRAEGPFPADSIFNRRYDGFLALYHDQAMIYLKSKKDGLNVTLGLPIIRLSPLYGAALDIAGKNKAEVSGLTTAIKTGIHIYRNVKRYE